jgi:hypothetical protein
MSKWQIHVEGGEEEIRLLSDLLSKSPFEFEKIKHRNFLSLPDVPADAPSEVIKASADQLIEVVNGAARLYYPKFEPVSYVSVTKLKDDGTRQGYGYLTAQVGDNVFTVVDPTDATLQDWVELGLEDDDVARALYLYGSLEPSWKNLYMVIEVIEDEYGGESELTAAGIVTGADLKLFKHTANSYRAVGSDARHATLATDPPKTSMTLAEAKDFVRALLKEWVRIKQQPSA